MKTKLLVVFSFVLLVSVAFYSSLWPKKPDKEIVLTAVELEPSREPAGKSYRVTVSEPDTLSKGSVASSPVDSKPTRKEAGGAPSLAQKLDSDAKAIEAEETLKNDPEFLSEGKVRMNLEHAFARNAGFLAENPRARALMEAGEKVPPEELNFPEGFQLNVLMEPRCLSFADSRFVLEDLDENGKALAAKGKPVFVSARLRDRAQGDELIASLENENCVARVGANDEEETGAAPYTTEPVLAGGNSTAFKILQNGGLIDLYNAIDANMFTTATIAVVDSGVTVSHPDLAGIAAGENDDGGHGTMVAGAAAAPANGVGTVGAMPFQARIQSYKVNRPGTTAGKPSDISNGILAAAYANMDVINVSWSGFSTGSYNSAIQIAVNEGSFVVGSAGNYGRILRSNSTIEGAVSVGALNGTNPSVASYSNYGPGAEIYTPGTFMTTTMGGSYRMASGTSFAAPQVGGIALMMKAYCKARGTDIAPARIEQLLKQTAQVMSGRRGEYQKMHALNTFVTMRDTGC